MTTTPIPDALLESVAEAIHNAKIESCWMKSAWEERKRKEPWGKPNAASPDQPWHDVSRDQAKAAIHAVFSSPEMQSVRESLEEIEKMKVSDYETLEMAVDIARAGLATLDRMLGV